MAVGAQRPGAGVPQRRQAGVVNLPEVGSQRLVGKEGLGAAFLGAGERPLVVVHPQVPLQPRFLDKPLGAVLALEGFFKRQRTIGAGVHIRLKKNPD